MLGKAQKDELVSELHGNFGEAGATFLLEYRGVTVEKMTELRNKLREADVEIKIVKNTLARIAVVDTEVEFLKDHFQGPVAVAFSFKDAAAAAKVLTEFAKDEPNLKFRLATLGPKVLEQNEVKALAELPPRDILLGRLVGMLNAVPTSFVGVLSAVPRQLVYALRAVENSKQ